MKKSPFTAKELNEFKSLLLEKKERLIKDIMGQDEELTEAKDESGDLVDQATNLLERNLNLSLSNAERNILQEIDDALVRIEEKSYGICVDTGQPIAKTRLKAIPEAKRTLEAQEKFDKLINKQRRLSRSV